MLISKLVLQLPWFRYVVIVMVTIALL